MTPRRTDRTDTDSETHGLTIGLGSLRAADEPARAAAEAHGPPDEERISLFWRVFGGTILSIVALVGINVFNNLSASISELRADLARANEARAAAVADLRGEMAKAAEARADLVRKDEFNTRITHVYERVQAVGAQTTALTGLRTEIDTLKERAARHTADADAIKKDVTAVEVLRERLTACAADLGKLRADVEKNQAYDFERRDRREAQCKQLEDAVRELQKGMQDVREKLARLDALAAPKTITPVGGTEPATIPKNE